MCCADEPLTCWRVQCLLTVCGVLGQEVKGAVERVS